MKIAPVFVAALLASGLALAQPQPPPQPNNPRLATLEAAYSRVQQEQQAVYQQFQMAQEMRRYELREASPPPAAAGQPYVPGMEVGRLPDYDENVRRQRERDERVQRYERDIAAAYARYQELSRQKKALLDQILELTQPPRR